MHAMKKDALIALDIPVSKFTFIACSSSVVKIEIEILSADAIQHSAAPICH
jgi:hypothetical protein